MNETRAGKTIKVSTAHKLLAVLSGEDADGGETQEQAAQ